MRVAIALIILLAALGGFIWFTLHWPYSVGQRAGYVQKLVRTGWPCKTWEGEMALVGSPLTSKFHFSVPSDSVAAELNASSGKLVALQYDQHKGLLTSCFGRSAYFIRGVRNIG